MRAATLSVDDLVVDPGAMTYSRAGTTIDLTPREFSVLTTLLRRWPDVVPKQDLLDSVWGIDFEGDPNIVEVYVGYLRRKIDRPFETETVRTVREVGYQITGRR